MNGHVYIAYRREFVLNGENIYKIGRSSNINDRPNGYPKGTVFLFTSYVDDIKLSENILVEKLKKLMIQRLDIGKEYFQGDYNTIRQHMLEVVDNVNLGKKVHMVYKRNQKNIERKQDDITKIKIDLYIQFVKDNLHFIEDKTKRLTQSEINQHYIDWLRADPQYQNKIGEFSPSSLKAVIESKFGEMIKSLYISPGKTNKGWKNIQFTSFNR